MTTDPQSTIIELTGGGFGSVPPNDLSEPAPPANEHDE